ncbi:MULTISPECIES: hypothetical protein [Bacillaceae]|uniref:hypothetical protein n=1 Tax=Bacillaceae TaxID=186817 RepID=UPI000C76E3D0|nr:MULTISPECIES: hypothetical protein [Bacillus]MCA1033851.1 hypothetical protein [Bacillus infantis]MCP1160348.1 hypothetical protein [Bacillus infantis]MDT0162293.1 hypothetical protein [Bacillus sp. AG4(2022)]MDW2879254.1 hypothetical protein [Bacillus infantis]PLR73855.1 hypothetical protein CYJ37_10100 [Bacillus sp. UMB0728]
MGHRQVFVLLTDTGTLFTKLIRIFTGKELNHASISFDEGLLDVYSFGRINPANPFSGGFVKEDVRANLFANARCAVYACTVSEQEYGRMQEQAAFFEENRHHYKYNLLGLFAVLFNWEYNRSNAFFCSEFVGTILKETNGCRVEKPVSLLKPHELEKVFSLHLVYKGSLSDYLQADSARPRLDASIA